MLSRRALVGKIAAGAAGAAAVLAAGGARSSAASVRTVANTSTDSGLGGKGLAPAPVAGPELVDAEPPATASALAPWDLIRPLREGSEVSPGWHLAELSGVVDGTCVVTLRSEQGRAYRVHVCRNDGHPQGLVYTDQFDLVVMNGGQGDLRTEEGMAQAVAAVAHVLAANEGSRRTDPAVTALLPHAERVRLFAAAADRRLR